MLEADPLEIGGTVMTAPGDSVLGPPLGEPIRVTPDGWGGDLVRSALAEHGTALAYARLAELRRELPHGDALRALLGHDWSRYLALADPEVRERYAASRLLIQRGYRAVLGGDPEALELVYGPTGRPYLRGCERIDISLGHADDLLLVGVTTRGLIGVNAERTDRPMYGVGLGRHVCTPYELVMLRGLPETERNPSLVRLLTLKEAYSRATGQGQDFRFTEFGFGPDGKPVRVARPDGGSGPARDWAFRTFFLEGEYSVGAALYDAGFGTLAETGACTVTRREREAAGGLAG